ncbi:MAG: hypothetical protein AAFN70_06340, partial [Planctomycetota bacterium]
MRPPMLVGLELCEGVLRFPKIAAIAIHAIPIEWTIMLMADKGRITYLGLSIGMILVISVMDALETITNV